MHVAGLAVHEEHRVRRRRHRVSPKPTRFAQHQCLRIWHVVVAAQVQAGVWRGWWFKKDEKAEETASKLGIQGQGTTQQLWLDYRRVRRRELDSCQEIIGFAASNSQSEQIWSSKFELQWIAVFKQVYKLQADSLFKEQIPHAESLSAKVELVKVQLAKLPTQRKWHIPTQKHPLFYWSFVSMSTHKLEFSLQFVPLASILIISLKAKLPVL